MKQVCGTCNFNTGSTAGAIRNEVLCAHDNKRHKDNDPACDKWTEYITNLTPQDRLALASSDRGSTLAIEANRLASEANEIAREAIKIARDEAASAARSARWAKYAAISAAIIAAITAREDIIWIIKYLLKLIRNP